MSCGCLAGPSSLSGCASRVPSLNTAQKGVDAVDIASDNVLIEFFKLQNRADLVDHALLGERQMETYVPMLAASALAASATSRTLPASDSVNYHLPLALLEPRHREQAKLEMGSVETTYGKPPLQFRKRLWETAGEFRANSDLKSSE